MDALSTITLMKQFIIVIKLYAESIKDTAIRIRHYLFSR